MRLLRGTAAGGDPAGRRRGRSARRALRRAARRRPRSFLRGERDVFEVNRNLLGKEIDFVGRGREMSILTDLYAGTLAESMASAVVVVGAPGIGKSRLREEFIDWVQRQPDRGEVLFGNGDSLGAGSPFATLGRAIRRAAGIHEGEPIESKRDKLAARVARHVESEARARVTVFLGEIANVPFPDDQNDALRAARANPQLMGDAMRRAWEDWLAAECAAHPVLVVLEDLHWGDLGTVSFVDAALRNLRDQPLDGAGARAPRDRRAVPRSVAGARAAGDPPGTAVEAREREAGARRAGRRVRRRRRRHRRARRRATRSIWRSSSARTPRDARSRCPIRCSAWCRRASTPRAARRSACCARRACSASASRGPGVAALLGGDGALGDVSDAIERLAARELVARAATPEGGGRRGVHVRARAGARGRLRDADRRRSGAGPPPGRRVAGAGGVRRRDGAGRALPPRRRAGARRALVRAGGGARRCAPTIWAPPSSAPRWG